VPYTDKYNGSLSRTLVDFIFTYSAPRKTIFSNGKFILLIIFDIYKKYIYVSEKKGRANSLEGALDLFSTQIKG